MAGMWNLQTVRNLSLATFLYHKGKYSTVWLIETSILSPFHWRAIFLPYIWHTAYLKSSLLSHPSSRKSLHITLARLVDQEVGSSDVQFWLVASLPWSWAARDIMTASALIAYLQSWFQRASVFRDGTFFLMFSKYFTNAVLSVQDLKC